MARETQDRTVGATSDVQTARRAALERRVLQALCRGTPEGSVKEEARALVGNYRWADPIAGAVFRAVMSIPSENPQVIREHLPARLTRQGFPDVDWEVYFQPHSLSKSDARALIDELPGST